MTAFEFNEKHLSQIPALQLLINLGFTYLTPEQALSQRGGKQGNVLPLEGQSIHIKQKSLGTSPKLFCRPGKAQSMSGILCGDAGKNNVFLKMASSAIKNRRSRS